MLFCLLITSFQLLTGSLRDPVSNTTVASTIKSNALQNVTGTREFANGSTFTGVTQNSLFLPTAAGTTNALLYNGF